MKKNSTSFRNSGAFTSPGTPEYADNNAGGIQKGWCSERIPLPTNNNKRHISAAALIPFSSGRALPSKWDDADRWITSPLSGNGPCKTSVVQPQRQPKSKSGPLGSPGVAHFTNYSHAVPVLEGGNAKSYIAGSPFTTGVLVADGLSINYCGGIGLQASPVHADNTIAQSSNAARWMDLLSESSPLSSQVEKLDRSKDSESKVPGVVSRRDMPTQMSPEGSPKERLSFGISCPSVPATVEPLVNNSAKVEVKDVQVDKGATVTRQSRKGSGRVTKKGSQDVKSLPSPWDVADAATNKSKLQREEAKISAWENLQKAKAEAAVKKLEMKLEKKRSASMDKILHKLKIAEEQAQELRELMTINLASQAPRTSDNAKSFRKFVKMGSIGGCFTSHVK